MLGDYTAGRYYTNPALEHPSRQAPRLNLTLTHVSDDDKPPSHYPLIYTFSQSISQKWRSYYVAMVDTSR